MEHLGGVVALADNGATVNCLVSPVGRVPGTSLGDVIPVSIGDASEIRINSTDIYCVELGGTEESARYDYMFRGGLYPDPAQAIGNVVSETILHGLLEIHSTPDMGRHYSLPGAAPLHPILAQNSCSYLTMRPLAGERAAALHAKAMREGMDTRSIHVGVILPSAATLNLRINFRQHRVKADRSASAGAREDRRVGGSRWADASYIQSDAESII